ncbi:MAG: choice-of-anchor D domain-containing protein, partial [bacterium]
LRIPSDDPDRAVVEIALSGLGIEAEVAVSPLAHDWGEVRVATAAVRTLEVRNEGRVALSVGAPTFEGASAAEFSAVPSVGFVVAPGETRAVQVTFRPLAVGARSAVLRLASDDRDEGVVDVALSGAGVEPDIDADARRQWGDLRVGTTSIGQLAIRNVGTSVLSVGSTEVRGKDAAEFAIVGGGGSFTLGPGEARALDVRFQPASPGAKNARLRVTSDDPDEEIVNLTLTGNGVAPEIAVDATAVDWGGVRIGAVATRTVQVRNDGAAPLAIVAANVIGTDAIDFAVVGGGGSRTLAPGATHQVEVAFRPSSAAPKGAVLRITSDDDDEGVLRVALSGTGVEPDIAVDQGHDWGDVRSGTGSSHALEVRNTGAFELAVSSVAVGGPAAEFAVTSGGGSFVVAPGAAHAIEVTFRPSGPGPRSSALRIRSDDRDEGVVDVALAGNGTEPDVATTVGSLDWGDVRIATATVRGLEVSNVGTADLAVSASVLGPDAAQFAIVAGGSATVAPGGTHRIDVRFGPSTIGPKVAVLRIVTDDPDEGTVDVALAGRGVEPEIVVSPPSREWGELRVGTSSAWTFTVRNQGTGDLTVGGATVEGANAAEFRVVAGGGGFTVAAGAAGTIRVAFQPAAVGTKSAALRIVSNDADEASVVVPLSGRGVEPDIAAGAG